MNRHRTKVDIFKSCDTSDTIVWHNGEVQYSAYVVEDTMLSDRAVRRVQTRKYGLMISEDEGFLYREIL